MNNASDEKLLNDVLRFQGEEITGSLLYGKLAKKCRDEHNAAVLSDMAEAEKRHYAFWKSISGQEVAPSRGRIMLFTLLAQVLGLTFALKLLEKGEEVTAADYARVASIHPGAEKMGEEEEQHEDALLGMIDEERLSYVGSIVLGLNDALVELTGTLAGLTFAFQKGKLVAVSGIITGIAAALSMAASNYLASKADNDPKAKGSPLHGRSLPHHGHTSGAALSHRAADRLLDLREPRNNPPHRRRHHRGLQLLRIGGPERGLQAALPRDGRHQPRRRILLLPRRAAGEIGLRG
jgi:VIT1/CCC1 family predicted Fe2+/Mn2+ transporter